MKPVTRVVGLLGSTNTTVAGSPGACVQVPKLGVVPGELAAMRAVVPLQMLWFDPAMAVGGKSRMETFTVSVLGGHVPFAMVQLNRYSPIPVPKTCVVGE